MYIPLAGQRTMISKMMNLKPSKEKWFVQGHKDGNWQNQTLNSSLRIIHSSPQIGGKAREDQSGAGQAKWVRKKLVELATEVWGEEGWMEVPTMG